MAGPSGPFFRSVFRPHAAGCAAFFVRRISGRHPRCWIAGGLLLSYGIGISMGKDRALLGKGSYEGLVFSESVQSAKEGG